MPRSEGTETQLISAVDLRKVYGAVKALRGVNLSIRGGEILGLCGHNGAGKSTLVKMLVGLEQPDSGELFVSGQPVTMNGVQSAQRQGIAIVDQELSLVPQLTVTENIFLGNVDESRWQRKAERRRRAEELLELVGLDHVSPTALVEDTSLGERQLIEIARLLGRNARVLILDEPTATLTDAEITHVFAAVRRVAASGASVIFVSHRLDEVLNLCSRVTVLRDGKDVASRLVEDMTKEDLVKLMLGELPEATVRDASTPENHVSPGSTAEGGLAVRHLSIASRVRSFSLEARPGTVVGLAGQLGSGADEVLAAIAGLAPEVSGRIEVDGCPLRLASPSAAAQAGVQYVSSDRKARGLFISRTIESNLVITRLKELSPGGVLRKRRARRTARRLADTVGIEARRLPLPVGTLSGGNQQKVFVGRCLDRPDLRVLLLDEPTRGVDVGGRADIHRLVKYAASEGAVVVFASTELDEVLDLSDLVVTLYGGKITSVRRRADTDAAQVFSEMTHRQTEAV